MTIRRPTHHYLGYDEHGLVHVSEDDWARCRPLFGIDQPLEVDKRIVPIDVPLTCLECIVRFTPRVAIYFNGKDADAKKEAYSQEHQLEESRSRAG